MVVSTSVETVGVSTVMTSFVVSRFTFGMSDGCMVGGEGIEGIVGTEGMEGTGKLSGMARTVRGSTLSDDGRYVLSGGRSSTNSNDRLCNLLLSGSSSAGG